MGNSAPQGPYSFPVPGTGKQGETAHYRSSWVQKNNKGELLQRAWVDVSTAHEAFLRGVRVGGDHQAMGVRKLLPDGKTRGDYVWEDYISVFNRVRDIASGLKSLGFERGTKLGIYSINRPEWVISTQACNAMSFVSVPLYDTLGPEAVSYIINQADIPLVICSADKLDKFSGEQLKTVPGLKYIISMDPLPDGKTVDGVKLMTWQDLLRLGAEKQIKFDEPKPDELCTICYTSGTTGDPKGVMLTHKNFVAVMSAMSIVTEISTADVHVSYLPLAHMYERAVLETVMCCGGQVGFFSGDILKLLDDIAVLKPTVFASVPRLYNRMYDRIKATVASSSDFAKGMFETAFNSKLETLKKGGGVTSFLWDSVVFSKTKARLGGRVRFMGSGAAPLQSEVQDFLKVTMCAPVLQGYGMTETCGITHVQDKSDLASGAVGGVLPCSEFKLVDVPEMSYFSTDNPPRGEVCVRGTNVFQGYFKMPDKTEECLEKDGWLHTGDIGVINPNGTLSIIDRKKNIFKLSQGEYVAAEKIENAYATHPWVQQIWVYGDSTQSVLVAVVVPDPEKIKAWAASNGHSGGDDVAAILADPKVKEMIYNDLTKHGKDQKLRGFEFVKNILLEPKPFSIENDLITPTFKLKRPQLKSVYKSQIDAMYAELAAKPSDEDRKPASSSSSSSSSSK